MLAALDPAPALSGAPGLDHETVARIIEVGEDDLTDVDAEAGSLRRVSRIDRNAPSTDLGLARPAGGTLVWGILGTFDSLNPLGLCKANRGSRWRS